MIIRPINTTSRAAHAEESIGTPNRTAGKSVICAYIRKKASRVKSEIPQIYNMFGAKARRNIAIILLLVVLVATVCDARRRRYGRRKHHVPSRKTLKQLEYEARETNTPNFVRLVLMRLVYGIATQMGIEDRLDDAFGGAFVPPNAIEESDDYLDVFSDEGDGDYGL